MENSKISLCIPTMDRFDMFLSKYIDKYIDYLNKNLIDEIIFSDENGNDYNKINEKYREIIETNPHFKVFKNESRLGVFKNKLKVCSYASNNYIALIDSDNFPDEEYFKIVKKYIEDNNSKFPTNVILSPSRSINHDNSPFLNYKEFENKILTKSNVKEHLSKITFCVLLNTGNYIISKNITNNIVFQEDLIEIISGCDVTYFNLLAFKQYSDLEFHVIKDLEYYHTTEDKHGEYNNRDPRCDNYRDNVIMREYHNLHLTN